MKRNIKKLVAFVMIALFVPFIMAVMASADPPAHRALRSQYAFTGVGQCLVALAGFDPSLQATNGLCLIDTSSWEGVYTFDKHGEGTVTAIYRINELPCPALESASPPYPISAGSANISWKFTYTMTDDGEITFTLVPGAYSGQWTSGPNVGTPEATFAIDKVPQDGVISKDGKSIVVTCGAPLLINLLTAPGGTPTGVMLNCNVSHVLIYRED